MVRSPHCSNLRLPTQQLSQTMPYTLRLHKPKQIGPRQPSEQEPEYRVDRTSASRCSVDVGAMFCMKIVCRIPEHCMKLQLTNCMSENWENLTRHDALCNGTIYPTQCIPNGVQAQMHSPHHFDQTQCDYHSPLSYSHTCSWQCSAVHF